MKIIEIEESDLLLIQEPYQYQNKPAGMEKKKTVYTAGAGKQSSHNSYKQQNRRHTNYTIIRRRHSCPRNCT
jgi:hypothetical protein